MSFGYGKKIKINNHSKKKFRISMRIKIRLGMAPTIPRAHQLVSQGGRHLN